MDGSEKEEVLSAVKELQRKVDALSAPLEDALAHRLFQGKRKGSALEKGKTVI